MPSRMPSGRPWVWSTVILLVLQGVGPFARPVEGALPDPPASRGRRIALVVGVTRYNSPDLKPLQYATRDAEHLAALLGQGGFDQVRLLASQQLPGGDRPAGDDRTRPTAGNIRRELQRLLESGRWTRDDLLVVAVSGHGSPADWQFRQFFLS